MVHRVRPSGLNGRKQHHQPNGGRRGIQSFHYKRLCGVRRRIYDRLRSRQRSPQSPCRPGQSRPIEESTAIYRRFRCRQRHLRGLIHRHSFHIHSDPYIPERHRNNHPVRRILERIPKNNPCRTRADKPRNHEIPRNRQHDPFHVLSHFRG